MKQIKEFLQKIVDGDLSVVKEDVFGICRNLGLYLEDCGIVLINSCYSLEFSYDFVGVYSIGWDKHSGNTYHPIEVYKYGNLWEGEQLKLRQSLCKYILDNMEEGNA